MIQSIERAIQILAAFSPHEPRLSLAEISKRVKLPKSTTHNILKTLVGRGYIERTDSEQYALGTALVSLAQAVRVNAELRDRAAPLLRELADATGETVYLTVFEDDHVLYIYAIETSSRLMARTAVGDRSPMHCTGVGKAILAMLPAAQVNQIIDAQGLPAFTENTITTLVALHQELESIRQRGYSIDMQEHELGTYCLGAAIINGHSQVVGGCSISGRDPAIVAERKEELALHLLYTAQEISRQLGYIPARPSQVMRPYSSNAHLRTVKR